MRTFDYDTPATRVIFGADILDRLPAEVTRLGGTRVLLLSGPRLASVVERARRELGALAVAAFDGAAMHTPVEVTERALAVLREHGADCLVAIGGGSTIGLAKALAARTDLPQVVLPSTYAGSEVTPVLGETEGDHKTTRSSPSFLPETVLYDVTLSRDLPLPLTVTSGINALAHAVEALYSAQANPVTDGIARQAVSGIAAALPRLHADPAELDARAELLESAWLAGSCLASVSMGLHHKLCHTLGGSFGLPHAETHTVLLPHAMAYNAPAAASAMAAVAAALGLPDAPAGVFDLVKCLGGPTSLRELGLAESDIPAAARIAAEQSYPNPRELTVAGIEGLLRDAWHGHRPASGRPDLSWLTEQVVDSFAGTPDLRLRELLTGLVRTLHGFVTGHDVTEREWQYAIDFLTRTGHITDDKRQEFVLLSDTLGVSSAVDHLTNSRTPGSTPSAVLGPFYVEGPPATEQGADLAVGLPGVPLWVDVRIADLDDEPLPGAVIDVWQSNEDGFYDVQLPDLDGPVLRARFHADDEGRLRFWTILPSEYPIPQDGPVGQMLTAAGRHPYRAPHLHFMISAPGCHRLVTQLFVAGGAYLDSDTVFGVKPPLIVDFAPQSGPTPDGRVIEGEWRRLDYDFQLAGTGE